MEDIIKNIVLIVTGGLLGWYINIYLEIKREREQKRWQQWYDNYRKK